MSDLTRLKSVIDARTSAAPSSPEECAADLQSALEECIALLDSGRARVAEPRAAAGLSTNG